MWNRTKAIAAIAIAINKPSQSNQIPIDPIQLLNESRFRMWFVECAPCALSQSRMITHRSNLDSAISRAEAELSRLTLCDDHLKKVHKKTGVVVAEVTQKLDELLARRSADRNDEFLNVGELLTSLRAEKSRCDKLCKQAKTTSLRRTRPKESAGVDSTTGVDNDINRLIPAILADGSDEFVAQGQGKLCAELVSILTGDDSAALDLKVWTATTSSAQYVSHPKQLELNKLSVVFAALPRLIEERVRALLSGDDNVEKSCVSPTTRQLPKELAERMLLSARLDTEDARGCSDILKLLASFDKRVATVRELLDQNDRLRDIEASEKKCQLRVDDVLNGVSRLRNILASRQEKCKSLVAKAAANAGQRGGAAAAAAQPEEAKSDPSTDYGTALEERCKKLLFSARAHVGAIGRMEDKEAAMHARAEGLAARITEGCQGSPETWCRNMRAAVHRDKKVTIVYELFKEFHSNPTRFAKRMRSAMRGTGASSESVKKQKEQ